MARPAGNRFGVAHPQAKLPEHWSLASFPFARQPGVNRKQIHAFAELEFIAKAENIVLVGSTGVGKTGLASGSAAESAWRMATAVSSSALRICSTKCMPRWPTVPRANC